MSREKSKPVIPAFGNDPSAFDKAMPPIVSSLFVLPKRLKLNGKTIPLIIKNKYSKHLFLVIYSALVSDWFQNLSSHTQLSLHNILIQFIRWESNRIATEEDRFSILKEFETYRVNDCKVKPQSSGLGPLLTLLNRGIHGTRLTKDTLNFIDILIRNTQISIADEVEPVTLTNFFKSILWLREELGDIDYLKLESPKRLIDSFSISVATTLLFIIKTKNIGRDRFINMPFYSDTDTLSERANNQYYCGNLFINLCKLDENTKLPSDNLTNLMILDFFSSQNSSPLSTFFKMATTEPKEIYNFNLYGKHHFVQPDLFSFDSWNTPSHVEQLLFAWLCAWQTVQPFDIAKLQRKNFVVSKNQLGRVVALQCIYYKGRSGHTQEPATLDARHIEAQAMIAYLEYFKEADHKLFNKKIKKAPDLSFSSNSIVDKISNLFEFQPILVEIEKNLSQRQSNPIFLKAYKALQRHGNSSYSKWRNTYKRKKDKNLNLKVSAYRATIKRPLPQALFGLSAIKTSAVHARSDKYRDRDLINQNSHTAQTEKISYLTDANKDWINQNGRITRMVIHDIEQYVYKPNLIASHEEAYELKLKTRVISALSDGIPDITNIKINTIGRINNPKIFVSHLEADPDDIIVLDTAETVVNMLHYINEANQKQHTLINKAISFFERSVLPNVEWMETLMMEKLTPSVVRKGQAQYEEIRHILPPLFENELRGGI